MFTSLYQFQSCYYPPHVRSTMSPKIILSVSGSRRERIDGDKKPLVGEFPSGGCHPGRSLWPIWSRTGRVILFVRLLSLSFSIVFFFYFKKHVMLSFRVGLRPARSKLGTYDFRAPSAPLKRQSGRKGEAIASSSSLKTSRQAWQSEDSLMTGKCYRWRWGYRIQVNLVMKLLLLPWFP